MEEIGRGRKGEEKGKDGLLKASITTPPVGMAGGEAEAEAKGGSTNWRDGLDGVESTTTATNTGSGTAVSGLWFSRSFG